MIVPRPELESAFESHSENKIDLQKPQGSHQLADEQFVRLLTSNYHALYRFILSLVGVVEAADDLTQECCLILWRKYGEFAPSGPDVNQDFCRWARGIAFNLARNFHRLRQPRQLALDDDILSKLASTQLGADELLEMRKEALHQCMRKLSASDRELLQICYGTGDTIDSVAARFKRSPNALYKVLRRIRHNLFSCINKTLDLE